MLYEAFPMAYLIEQVSYRHPRTQLADDFRPADWLRPVPSAFWTLCLLLFTADALSTWAAKRMSRMSWASMSVRLPSSL